MAIRVDGKILLDSIKQHQMFNNQCNWLFCWNQAGFIIKYTGTGTAGSIAHGLSEQPKFVIIKDLKNANAWPFNMLAQHLERITKLGAWKCCCR